MSKTADVLQAIWADPWFNALPTPAKLTYLWAITNEHSNLAGLYVVAKRMILFETGLTAKQFDAALIELKGKLVYEEPTGVLWAVGRAKRVRSRTPQIAKSIARAVRDCPSATTAAAFVEKYSQEAWLRDVLADLSVYGGKSEPLENLAEVLSQSPSQSHSPKAPTTDVARAVAAGLNDWLTDHETVTARRPPANTTKAYTDLAGMFNGRLADGLTLADLKGASRAAHANDYRRENGYDRAASVLRAGKCNDLVEDYRRQAGHTNGSDTVSFLDRLNAR